MLYFARAFCYTKYMDDYVRALKEKCADRISRYNELAALTEAHEIIADNRLWLKYVAEKRTLERSVKLWEEVDTAFSLGLTEEYSALIEELSVELLDKQGSESAGAILELYATDDVSEALAEEMLGMYLSYLKSIGYECSAETENTRNGLKYSALSVNGNGAYFRLKGEVGLHRSSDGGLVTVTVIPEATEDSVLPDPKDIRTDIFHATGAGGQNINKVATAVRLTHIPTGITVVCRDERSQLRNRERAYKTLVSKINAEAQEKRNSETVKLKRSSVSTAKTQRIRLYDRKSGFLTDLRTGVSVEIKDAHEGKITKLINSVILKNG